MKMLYTKLSARKLDASERPKVLYEYSVRGDGQFPIDMLRYDSCWPATQDDVANITYLANAKDHIIKLRSYREPTEARWESFRWKVV